MLHKEIPEEFINFILLTLFSLIIGLAQRRLHTSNEAECFIVTCWCC